MSQLRFGTDDFAFVFAPKAEAIRHAAGASAEVRTLGSLEIVTATETLTRATDGGTTVDDIPLIDLASWLAASWDDLLYDVLVPAELRARRADDEKRQPVRAQLWASLGAVSLSPSSADRVFEWAEHHALEFSASDYELPNVVFQRVDDSVEASWSARLEPSSGSDVMFDARTGLVVTEVEPFVAGLRSLLGWVREECRDLLDDPRVAEIASTLDERPEQRGRRIVDRWVRPDERSRLVKLVPDKSLRELGTNGSTSQHVVGFLRSSAGVLAASDALTILEHVERPGRKKFVGLAKLPHDTRIDPREPWESGLRIARQLRLWLGLGTGPCDPFELLDRFHIQVVRLNLDSSEVDGACFLTTDGYAWAVLNENGRLARTTNGQRTTIAHELCHLLVDASNARTFGQLDMRLPGTSYLEKRANAFAAEFLLPRAVLLQRSAGGKSIRRSELRRIAREYGVSTELAEHQARNQELEVVE